MTTELSKPLRRAIDIQGRPYVVTLDVTGLKLVEKGRRKGLVLLWDELVSGEAALATALNASLHALPEDRPRNEDVRTGSSRSSKGGKTRKRAGSKRV